MDITLSPELERRITQKIERGDVGSADALVEQALNFYLDYEEGETDESDRIEAKAAIDEALDQAERGEGRPADEVFARLRARHGLSR